MNYISIDEVYAIHLRMIAVGGGRGNIHDFILLHSAIERSKVTFGGKELYPTIWNKAAALIHSLVKNHPFDDGNKRTAYYSTKRFLFINGWQLVAKKEDVIRFMVSLDVKNFSLLTIERWVHVHSKHLLT